MNYLTLNQPQDIIDSFFDFNWERPRSRAQYHCDYKEGTYYLTLSCPGFDKKEIDITYDGELLSVKMCPTQNDKDQERPRFSRTKQEQQFKLKNLDFKSAQAHYKNGILSLVLPEKSKKSQSLSISS